MKLSPNFDQSEFEMDAPIPPECVEVLTILCTQVLEPIRKFADAPTIITSGYRPPAANEAAHGQPDSQHMYTPDWCAADVYFQEKPTRFVFDWVRNNVSIPFYQLILEHGANGSTILHVSYDRTKPGQRHVLEGATHNSEPYIQVDHVSYQPPAMGVETSTDGA